jgi:excisionase family DNA binding protein
VSEKSLLSIREFAVSYNVGRSTVYRLIGSGDLPAVKLGKRTMIRRTDADAWMASLKPYRPCKMVA